MYPLTILMIPPKQPPLYMFWTKLTRIGNNLSINH